MKYYKLFDFMAPQGDLYRVNTETGQCWCLDANGERPIEAFVLSAEYTGTTQFFQLQDYASKYGRLEEVNAP